MTTNDAPPSSSSPPAEVGAILAGKFRVDRVLGAGGMGVVVEATHLALRQRVAIKFLNQRGRENPDAVARFQREGRAAAKLRSKHVVRVMDVGALDDGQPYLVMEYLEGRDLASALKDGPMGVDAAIDVMLQICDAVGEAHKAGIVHRDLKPSNVFLTTDNNGAELVKVLDFGISKVDDDALSLTSTSELLGSPLYMSPEHLRASRDVDPRSDVWSLGVMLYEMLTGRRPFTGVTMPELVFNVLDTSPEAITTIRDDVPAHVVHAVEKCLAKERADRVASVAELVQMLAPDRAISKSTSTSTKEPLAVSTSAGVSRPPAERPEPGSRRPLIVGGVVAALVLGLGGWRLVARAPEIPTPVAGSASAASSRGSEAPADDPASVTLRAELAQQGWRMSGGASKEYAVRLDPAALRNGRPTLSLLPIADPGDRYGTWLRVVDAKPYLGRRVRIWGYTRTAGAPKKAELWARVQAADSPVDGVGLGGEFLLLPPESDWAKREIVLDVPESAASIHFGIGVLGTGRIWLDEPTIELVGDDVPLSGHAHDKALGGWLLTGAGAEATRLDEADGAVHASTPELATKSVELVQLVPASAHLGKRAVASFEVRTRDLTSGAACFLEARASRHAEVPLAAASKTLPPSTAGSTVCELEVDAAKPAAWIAFGVRHVGRGEVWVRGKKLTSR